MSDGKNDKEVRSTELLRTSQSWDDTQLPDYLQGRPELVAGIFVSENMSVARPANVI